MSHRNATACLWAVLIFFAFSGMPANADYNSLKLNLQFGIRYDDNPRFELDGTETDGAQGLLIDVGLPYEHRRETWSTSIRPRYVRSFYRQEENSDLEDEDIYLLGSTRKVFPRSNIGASYGYTNLSLRTSEFEDPEEPLPGQPPSSNRVIRNFEDSQKNIFFVPSWQHQLSPADLIGINAGYRQTNYDISRPTSLSDSESRNVGAFYRHALNEKHTVGISANLSGFVADNSTFQVKNDSTSNSVSLIYAYSWTETATISTNLGWARTKLNVSRPNAIIPFPPFTLCDPQLEFCRSKSSSDNFVGNISLDVARETTDYFISIGQQVTPNSNGAQTLRFTINGIINRKFNDRLSGRLGFLLFSQSNVGDSAFDFDNDYFRPTVNLNYKLTRKWSLYARYYYTWSQQKTTSISSESTTSDNFVSVGFRFSGDGITW